MGGRRSDLDAVFAGPTLLNDDGDITASPLFVAGYIHTWTAEAGVRSGFDTGPVTHEVSVGTVVLDQEQGFRVSSFGQPVDSNIFDPLRAPRPSFGGLSKSNLPKTQQAVFSGLTVGDTLSILNKQASLLLGGRLQRVEQDDYDADTGSRTSSYDDQELTPALGIVVKPWDWLSIYGNYIEGLSPGPTAPPEATNAGESFPPIKTEQREVGAKLDLGRFAATLSLFEIKQPSAIIDIATGVFDVDGEQRNRGVELELFGEPLDGVRLLGGIALLDAELTQTEGGTNDGNDVPGVPRWQANLLAEWDVPQTGGLTIGGGAIHNSSSELDTANTQSIPSWTQFNMAARYTIEFNGTPVTLRVAVENVLDSNHWQSSDFFLTQSQPRTFLLSTSVRF